MKNLPIKTVADTAFMVAALRAQESARPSPLFRDPLAARLAGEHGTWIIGQLPMRGAIIGWSVVIRTYIIDQMIHSAISEGIDTVLNLGAGLDTRPYRLELPSTLRWIEVDVPAVIEHKESLLAEEQPRCRLERVGLDLSDHAAREKFLHDLAATSKRILVLTEGVILYLPPEAVASLATNLKSEPSYQYWIVDYFSPESYRYRRRSSLGKALRNAPFLFEPADFYGFFRDLGWKTKSEKFIPEEGTRLNRPMPLPWAIQLWLKMLGPLIPAKHHKAMRQLMGYVVLEPTLNPLGTGTQI